MRLCHRLALYKCPGALRGYMLKCTTQAAVLAQWVLVLSSKSY